MRKTLIALLAVLLVLASAPAAGAKEHKDKDDKGGTYLALGDSVAAGTQQPAPFTDDGYTNLLYEHLEKHEDFDTFVNLACPGDDTTEMISDVEDLTLDPPDIGSLCYGLASLLPPGGSSQLDAAVAYLTAHPGEVELITITIGANDVLACEADDPDFNACIGTQLGKIGANLPVILGTLQAVAPGVPIVGMNYYNPNLAYWVTGPAGQALAAASLGLTDAGNGVLEAVYDAFGVPVADVESAFKTFKTKGKTPKNVKEICKLTLMCEKDHGDLVLSDYDPVTPGPQTDIHPSDKGYKKIYKTFKKLIKKQKLLR